MLKYILLLVTFLNFFLSFFVISQDRKSWNNRFFFLLSFLAGIWTFTNFMTGIYATPFWLESTYAFGSLVISAGLMWTFILTDKFLDKKKLIFVFCSALFFFVASFWNGFIAERYDAIYLGGAFIGKPATGLIIYTIYFIIIASLILYKLFSTRSKIDDIKTRNQFLYVFYGALATLFISALTSFILPSISIFSFGGLDSVSFLIFLSFIAYAITKHQLFNIKVIATELLTFTIWIAVLFELLIADTWKERLFEGGLLLFVIVFGILLIKSVLKEVHQREEMEKLSKELKVINEKLVETDKMKAGMYSFVSHQIKAPMGIVKGFAELLAQNAYGKLPKKAKETVENIEKAANRLIRLVEDFLDLRRIEEGRMDYEFKEINIVDLVKSVFEELKLLANQKKLEFIFNITTSDVVKVRADEQRLRQVIMNLIENAIKYTEKGFVKVECQMSDVKGQKSVLFSVSDSGIGIKPEVLPELFDQFKRAKEARLIQGTGLGLYIAREIVKAHGGEIWAESDGEGKGSGFYVRLKMNE